MGLALMVMLTLKISLPAFTLASESKTWPAVAGEVLKNQLASKRGKKRNQYQLDFSYQYLVDGKMYEGKGRYYDLGEPRQGWKGSLPDFVEVYPVGAEIQVYYQPDSPDISTIEKGILLQNWILLGVGIFFILMMLHLVIYPHKWKSNAGRKRKRR